MTGGLHIRSLGAPYTGGHSTGPLNNNNNEGGSREQWGGHAPRGVHQLAPPHFPSLSLCSLTLFPPPLGVPSGARLSLEENKALKEIPLIAIEATPLRTQQLLQPTGAQHNTLSPFCCPGCWC